MALPDSSRLQRNPGTLIAGRFRGIGLTRDYVRRMTGRGDDLRNPLIASRQALFSGDAAAVGLRLFFCGESFPRQPAAACLGEDLLRAVLDCGLLAEAGPDSLAAPFHLRIVGDLYLFSDYLGRERHAVMGAGETTAILFRAARPSRPAGYALDLGCGAGTLALLLAAHAGSVAGTDINPRAIALARLNASVNGIRNVEFRCGDVWEPVAHDVFDLIVSQPPYYPNAAARGEAGEQVFLHGGERGDEIPRRVIEGIPRHLAPPGRALVFASWPETGQSAAGEGMRVLELRTDRREVQGTRQSINVVEFPDEGMGWYTVFDVSADHWSSIDSARIDRLLAADQLVRSPGGQLLDACLRLPESAAAFREGSQMILQLPLAGTTAVDDRTWEVISAVNAAPSVRSGIDALASPSGALPIVKRALRRGLLAVQAGGRNRRAS